MTGQQMIGLATGLGYLIAMGLAVPAVKYLGPTYKTHKTMHPGYILVGVVYALALFIRGVTIVFPGKAVAIEAMSWIAPMVPCALILVNACLLDFIQRHRAPPPLFETIIRAAVGHRRSDEEIQALAFALPPAAAGDAPSDEVIGDIGKVRRVSVLIACGVALIAIVLVIIQASPITGG